MPSNYIIGFDVDPKDVGTEQLKAAELLLSEINKTIGKRQKNVNLTIPGRFPALKTALINPMFNTFAVHTRSFSVDDTCTGCGICEKICPVHTIRISDTGKPVWGKACTQCLGCINRCPAHAIQYGKGTVRKRQILPSGGEPLESQVQNGEKTFNEKLNDSKNMPEIVEITDPNPLRGFAGTECS